MALKYICNDCGRAYETDKIMYLCSFCEEKNVANYPPKGVLRVFYDYEKLSKDFNQHLSDGFINLLPISDLRFMPNLRVGNTPLYAYTFERFSDKVHLF
jgi:threonine synthase